MLSFNCPSCGASVNFKSKASVFAVCSFCKSTLVRHDMDLENVGVMSDLQDDYSPFQIGTKGTFGKKQFELIGRLRVAYPDGVWNEWHAWFNDDKPAWLAEAQGFLAVCFAEEKASVPGVNELWPGREFVINDRPYVIVDKREVRCVYSEGELPRDAAKGRESLSVDLAGPEALMGTIEYVQRGQQPRVFIGAYQDFDDFKFTNLRKLDGW